jgi:glutamate dehydrogenase
MSFKLEPSSIPDLPEPRPRFEIFVYSPRVEGVHLRFGAVARGGLRWSDRRDDFRTEVLGLVKAQMVKNTVIVPVGAKGGFFCKQLPDPSNREAWLAEGVTCYRTFISGLLDITDNLVEGESVPPMGVVRRTSDEHVGKHTCEDHDRDVDTRGDRFSFRCRSYRERKRYERNGVDARRSDDARDRVSSVDYP